MTESTEMRRRVYDRIRQHAAAGGFALPARAGDPPPEDPEIRAKWEARALEELKSAPRVKKYDSGKGCMVEMRMSTAPKPTPPSAPRPAAPQGPSDDEIRATALRLGITESQARDALTAPLSTEDLAFCEKHNLSTAEFSRYARKE